MDFQGQKLAEQLLLWLIIGFAAAGFLAGYLAQDFQLMVKLEGVGLVVSLLAVLPDWPLYNRNPTTWLAPLFPAEHEAALKRPWYASLMPFGSK